MVKCKNCKYWVRFHNGEKGNCQRFQPEIVTEYDHIFIFGFTTVKSQWPETGIDDMCGEGVERTSKP
jgi:hypothetical protein